MSYRIEFDIAVTRTCPLSPHKLFSYISHYVQAGELIKWYEN